jgi:hypothetical protein
MSIATLYDIARVEAGYILYAALYYVLVVYPIIWYRRRRPK